MKKKWLILAPLGLAVFIAVGGVVVEHLWNWLLPELFGWREINFWQSLGLLALCRILFGGFGGHGPDGPRFRRRAAGPHEPMTPEEREKLRQGIRARCVGAEAPAAETREPA